MQRITAVKQDDSDWLRLRCVDYGSRGTARPEGLTRAEQELQSHLAEASSAALASLGNLLRLNALDEVRAPAYHNLPVLLDLVAGAEQKRALRHGWGSALGDEESNPLLAVPEEVAINIACQLYSPLDLLSLSKACKRFWLKTIPHSSHRSVHRPGPATRSRAAMAPEMLSIVSEAARRWVAGDSRVPKRDTDSYLSLMRELQLLRRPL